METHPMLSLKAWTDANDDPTLMIADGRCVKISVQGGTPRIPAVLVIQDGPMGDARTRKLERVPRTVKHLAILTNNGSMSFNAQGWLADVGITWAVIDRSGKFPRTLGTSGRYINPRYMRQQAMCAPGGPAAFTGIRITRALIAEKLEGQARNAETFLNDRQAATFIRSQIPAVQKSRSLEKIRGYEGAAADAYWDSWRGEVIEWKKPYPKQDHWHIYPSRRSLRYEWETNRNATDPVNALINFAYKMCETESALACYAAALSPAMGIMHVDRPGRDSFALDVMEIMRPRADHIVSDILSKPLNKDWFRETPEGTVQCNAPLTHKLLAEVHKEAFHITRALFTVVSLLDKVKVTPITE